MAKKILVVDNQEKNIQILHRKLIEAGFSVIATNGEAAKDVYYKERPDLVIFDTFKTNVKQVELHYYLRQLHSDSSLLLLTSKGDEYSTISALEAGADDIMLKPYSPRELVARIRSIFRRKEFVKEQESRKISTDDLVILSRKREAFYEGRKVFLTPIEYKLIIYMAERRGENLSRDALTEVISDNLKNAIRSSLDVHIAKLRDKFSKNLISTVYGIGYRMNRVQEKDYQSLYIKQHRK